MTAIRVEVTAEHIAASGDPHRGWDEPVAAALSALTDGERVDIDSDGYGGHVATIGQGVWTLVVDLPEPANEEEQAMGKIIASYLVKVHLHAADVGADEAQVKALSDGLTNDVVQAAVIAGLENELGGEVTVSLIERTDAD